MPAQYKYEFIPKDMKKALEIALGEFRKCKKQMGQVQDALKPLQERVDFLGALLEFGVHGFVANDELREKIKAAISRD